MNGRPLVDYALKAAIDSGVFHLIIVSSNDMEVLEHTYSYFGTNVVQPHKRPDPLCGGDVPIKTVVRYVIQSYRAPDVMCLLQPTNPLITAKQIKDAYMRFQNDKPNYLIGMCKGKDIGFHFFQRDAFLREYEAYDKDFFGTNWIPYEMEGVDIDTMEDWEEAERLIRER